jgi:general secretion pathway protein J
MTPRVKAASRGMTMIEVVVAMGILAMVAVLIHGVIDSLSRGKKAEGMRSDRAHEGREALQRIVRDLSSAYLSLHVPAVQALITSKTAFVGRSSIPFDRVDFTAFAHRRTERDSHESDQAEVGYFVVGDPDVPGKMDLVRREQTPIDIDPLKGGIVDVVAEDVSEFHLTFATSSRPPGSGSTRGTRCKSAVSRTGCRSRSAFGSCSRGSATAGRTRTRPR